MALRHVLLLVNLLWQLEAQKTYLTAPDKRGTREISTTGGVSRRTVASPTNSRQATAVRAAAKRESTGRAALVIREFGPLGPLTGVNCLTGNDLGLGKKNFRR